MELDLGNSLENYDVSSKKIKKQKLSLDSDSEIEKKVKKSKKITKKSKKNKLKKFLSLFADS